MDGTNQKGYKLLEDEFIKFKTIQRAQKQRGLNDFNVFTTLLSKNDEVRLHGRFIASLLDVNGSHYQSSLFLDLFLQCFKPEEFEFDAENSRCFREYQNIDIYLTDGSNHIIIENKVYAGDQNKQVQRYIENIVEENPNIEENQIWFCYLSIDRLQPSKSSLGKPNEGGFEFNHDQTQIVSDKVTTLYSNVHYKNDIPAWLEQCQREVGNLKDLSVAIEQYQAVVAKMNRTYKSNVMNLEEYLQTLSAVDEKTFLSTLVSASKELPKVRFSMMENFFEKLRAKVEADLPEGWEVIIKGGVKSLETKYSFPFRVSRANNPLIIGLEFRGDNFVGIRTGVARKDRQFDNKAFAKHGICQEKLKGKRIKPSKWWLHKADPKEFKGSLWEKIIEEGEESVLNKLQADIVRWVNEFESVCDCSAKYHQQNKQ